jgi:hypothetical protein
VLQNKRVATKKPSLSIYELKITLLGIDPPIWRRVQTPDAMLLCCLHDVLQAVLGWTDSHLHQFQRGETVWGVPELYEDDDIEVADESQTSVNRVLKAQGESLVYEYDFGDDWKHEILLEKIISCEVALVRPVCLAGERSCPPEDVGGFRGYKEFLDVIFDPGNEEFEHYRAWAGDSFQPEHFDLKAVNETLARMRWPKRHRRS